MTCGPTSVLVEVRVTNGESATAGVPDSVATAAKANRAIHNVERGYTPGQRDLWRSPIFDGIESSGMPYADARQVKLRN